MDITSTHFLTFREIIVDDTDLFEDAWGFKSEFSDIYDFLGKPDTGPYDCLVDKIVESFYKRSGN